MKSKEKAGAGRKKKRPSEQEIRARGHAVFALTLNAANLAAQSEVIDPESVKRMEMATHGALRCMSANLHCGPQDMAIVINACNIAAVMCSHGYGDADDKATIGRAHAALLAIRSRCSMAGPFDITDTELTDIADMLHVHDGQLNCPDMTTAAFNCALTVAEFNIKAGHVFEATSQTAVPA